MLLYLHYSKNQKYFHEKMFKIKQIKQIKTTTNIKKEKYFFHQNLLKTLYFFLLSIFNIFLTYNLSLSLSLDEDEDEDETQNLLPIIENNNNNNTFDIEKKNSWLNNPAFFYGGIFLVIAGTCLVSYYMYTNEIGFFSIPSTQNVLLNDFIFENININLVLQYKTILENSLGKMDAETMHEVLNSINTFLENPSSIDGEVSLKMLYQILDKIVKSDNFTNLNTQRIIVRTLDGIIEEFQKAINKVIED